MGGMLTLIGTPPNLVIQEALTEAGYEPLKFFSFLPVGVVCIIVGIVVLLPLSKRFLSGNEKKEGSKKSRRKTLSKLMEEYQLADNRCSPWRADRWRRTRRWLSWTFTTATV